METTWETPQAFFDFINREFEFTLDVASDCDNVKCKKWFSPIDDGLLQDWSKDVFWMNPPYGRGQNVYAWVKKAYDSSVAGGTGVCLLPASVDTKWFHEYCLLAAEIRFVKDRLWFSLRGKAQRANHASMLVIFRQRSGPLRISTVTNQRTRDV